MSRTLARTAITRALRQYLDLLEPILPPPYPALWLTDHTISTTYVMSTLNHEEEIARAEIDAPTKSAVVIINAFNIYEFIPEADEHITERIPQLPYDPRQLAYTLAVDLSDLDWPTLALDDDTPARKLPPLSASAPATASYQKVKRG